MKKAVVALFVCLVAPFAVGVAPAHACLRAMHEDLGPEEPNPAADIAQSERHAEAGRYAAAMALVKKTFPKLANAVPGKNPLETRGLRIAALVAVRSHGVTGVDKDASTNLAWSLATLRKIAAARAHEPAIEADLGEALAAHEATREEAMAKLEALADRDLIGSPHAYAALARLRMERGDAKGSASASKRCASMSKSAPMCDVKPTRPRPEKPVLAAKA